MPEDLAAIPVEEYEALDQATLRQIWEWLRTQFQGADYECTQVSQLASKAGQFWMKTGLEDQVTDYANLDWRTLQLKRGVGITKIIRLLSVFRCALDLKPLDSNPASIRYDESTGTAPVIREKYNRDEIGSHTDERDVQLSDHAFQDQLKQHFETFRWGKYEELVNQLKSRWNSIQDEWNGIGWSGKPIGPIAELAGYRWPRTRASETLHSYVQQDSPDQIAETRGFGKNKAYTILVILAVWEQLPPVFREREFTERTSLPFQNQDGSIDPVQLVSCQWEALCNALKEAELTERRLSEAAAAIGIRSLSRSPFKVSHLIKFSSFDKMRRDMRGIGKNKAALYARTLASLWSVADPSGPAGPPPKSPDETATELLDQRQGDSLSDLLAQVFAVAELKEKEVEILGRRFGLDGRMAETLEEIGADEQVTRERIRQKEAKAIDVIHQIPLALSLLKQLYQRKEANMITRLVQESGTPLIRTDCNWKPALGGELHFLMEMVAGSFEGLMRRLVSEEKVSPTSVGWWTGAKIPVGAMKLGETIVNNLKAEGRAIPVHCLAHRYDLTEMETTHVLEANGVLVHCGIAFPRRLFAVQRRSLLAMETAIRGNQALWHEPELFMQAATVNPEVARSLRLFQRDLAQIPELFIDMLGPYAAANPKMMEVLRPHFADTRTEESECSKVSNEDETEEEEDTADETEENLESKIHQIVNNLVIARFETIEEEFSRLRAGASGSLGPIMMSSSRFTRYAPGVWGVWGLELSEENSEILCNDIALRRYVEAKHGGGLVEMYPFWTPRMEYRWYRWAEQNASRELFESLMSVVEPDTWPIPIPLREQGKRKQAQHGVYRLVAPDATFETGLTDFASYYGLIMMAAQRGRLGYAAVGSYLGWRFMGERRAFSAIAVLVAIGVLVPDDDRSVPHQRGPRAEEWLDRMTNDYTYDTEGSVAKWPKVVMDELNSVESGTEYGWFTIDKLRDKFGSWQATDEQSELIG